MHSGRGRILDRNGDLLAGSRTGGALVVLPSLLPPDKEGLAADYAWVPNIKDITTTKANKVQPYILAENITLEEQLAASLPPGIITASVVRRYGTDSLAPHVTGYLSKSGVTGLAGLELAFNRELSSGEAKFLAAIVDGRKRLIPGLGYRYRSGGQRSSASDVHTTIDLSIQKIVEDVMDEGISAGAAVVLDPWEGDILAMASRPDFNPNDVASLFTNTQENLDLLDKKPFINRAISSYFPGSTVKAFLAAAALDTGLYSLSSEFNCPGYIELGQNKIGCVRAHGTIDFSEAIAYSCNAAFIRVGLDLGLSSLLDYYQKFGLGEKTGLPLQGESGGILPAGDAGKGVLALASIGQGDMGVTPLQLARAYAVIANGGYLVNPRLVNKVATAWGFPLEIMPAASKKKVLEEDVAAAVKKMMHQVTQVSTGKQASSSLFEGAGKTGTAETGNLVHGEKELVYWYGGFAPLDRPKYVVVVFIEEGENMTPPLAFKKIMEKILFL
ncbi:MAG TPA: penicillin-binding protein 2 [Firmicutes bacterium]|nr:penicillin-binding protein 2 [Bacillota bacterium]